MRERSFDFITIGGATEDITLYTDDALYINNKKDILKQKLMAFEYGAKLNVERSHSSFGGGAANAAVGLARSGFSVSICASIGSDCRGQELLSNFQAQRVDTSLIQKQAKIETGFSFFIVGRDKEHVCFSSRAANQKLTINAAAKKALAASANIYMTSLSGNWRSVLKAVFSLHHPRLIWNPGHIQLKAGAASIGRYLSASYVLTLNKDEATELAVSVRKNRSRSASHLSSTRNLLRMIKDLGPSIVVITSGAKGADAYDGLNFYHQNVFKPRLVADTTGVGDAFGSTFSAGLTIYKGDIQAAMRLAAQNCASVIARPGAQNGLLAMPVRKGK